MAIYFFGDPIPNNTVVVDQLERRFVYIGCTFRYDGRIIPAADLEWPILSGGTA